MPSVTVKRYSKIFNFASFDFKAFLLLFEWVGSWCSVTRAVIFFLMNSLFEEKCNSGCPKTIKKIGQIHEIVLAGKTTTLRCCISKTAG